MLEKMGNKYQQVYCAANWQKLLFCSSDENDMSSANKHSLCHVLLIGLTHSKIQTWILNPNRIINLALGQANACQKITL